MPSRLYRVICHNGLEIAPEHPMAAVKNLGHALKCDPASLRVGKTFMLKEDASAS